MLSKAWCGPVLCALALGCAAPELPLPPGGICMDVSHLTKDQARAFRVASQRWEPHFEPVRVVNDPACGNAVWNDVWNEEFDGSTKPMTTQLNHTPFMERADTQVFIRPGLDVKQWALETMFTHEFAHIFGRVEHTDSGLLSARPYLTRKLALTDEDRAHVGALYK